MARKIMKETWYTFNPATKTITFPRYVPQEHLILITDITANKVLYNFSDPSLGYTSYSSVVNNDGTELTTIVLTYNTSALSSVDEIQVVIDEFVEQFTPSEESQDSVGKLKISTPQALIDTDFEYGPQYSKWESISAINNRQTSYGFSYNNLNVSTITTGVAGSRAVTVALNPTLINTITTSGTAYPAFGNASTGLTTYTTSTAHGLQIGQYVTISGIATITGYNVNNAQIVSVPSATTFTINNTVTGVPTGTGTVVANVSPPLGSPINVVDTLYTGSTGRYSVESIPTAAITAISAGTGTQVTYTTTTPPAQGQAVTITGATTAGANGTFIVQSVVANTSFTVNNTTTGITTSTATATLISQFTYTAKVSANAAWASTNILDTNKTLIIQENYYSQAAVGGSPTMAYTSQTGGSPVTVTTTVPHGLSIGNEVLVVGTSGVSGTNGSFAVSTINSATQFVYYTPSTLTGTLATTATATGTAASASLGSIGSSIFSVGTITGSVSVGMGVSGVGIPSGATVIAITTGTGATTSLITISSPLTAAVTATTYTFNASIYMRPQGQVVHRAFDGGILFSTNAGSNNQSLIRQTRRYFRYQSGKAVSMSSGTILKPTLNVDYMTASATAIGSTVTVTTKEKHNFQPGYQVTVYGSTDSGYNGIFAVANVLSQTQFTYLNTAVLASTNATGTPYISTNAWYGAVTRLGIFDNQNGAYWEFDGQNLYAVRRSSVYQIAGRVSVTQGSTTVTGSSQYATLFSKQLTPGDWIVLRGQSYRIQDIASDTSMTISPAYRGTTASQVIVSKTVNTKTKQSNFNIDQLDGHGPTGYNLDLSKMQMFFVDYSWYGAGSIRWGLRTNRGNIAWVHRLPNNNANATAYMRSGNLPGRYESATLPPATYLTASVATTDTSLTVADTSAFPISGTLIIRPGSSAASGSGGNGTGNYEVVNYTGTTSTSFTGLTRIQGGATTATLSITAGTNTGTVSTAAGLQIGQRVINSAFPEGTFISAIAGTNVTFSTAATATLSSATAIFPALGPLPSGVAVNTTSTVGNAYAYQVTAPVSVELAYPTYGPGLSHWGTSVIMDGRFDDDKSLLFTYGQTTPTIIAPNGGTTATTTTSAAAVVTLTAANANIVPGMLVSGIGVQDGTWVTAVNGTSVTLNQSPIATLTSTALTFYGSSTKALFSIRIAPSVDNGLVGQLGSRELVNRMQLILKALDISLLNTTTGNVLVQAYLNGVPVSNPTSSATPALSSTLWTNAIRGAILTPTSSLAQIADYAGSNTNVVLGEVAGGFFANSTGSIDLSTVRDLGNSVNGGGGAYANNGIYPDGPDTLTIVVTNLSTTPVSVLGRLSWTEAQA